MEENRLFVFMILTFNIQLYVQCDGPEKRLFRKLFTDYNPSSRPAKNANNPVVVKFGVALNQILDLDEKMQILTTSIWITESWIDEDLVWSTQDFDELDTLIVPATHLWIPDIFIFNGAGGELGDFVNVTNGRLQVKNNGHITWLIPLMIKSACRVDATYFPYDEQTCSIHFGSWIYDESQLDLQPFPVKPDLDNYIINSEFELIDVTMNRKLANERCCPGSGSHPMIVMHIHIKRKSIYYDYIVIAPTMLLSILSLFSFCLPSHHGDKISIGLTVFLTLYVLQLLISANVPDTNTTPILGIYTFLVMTLNCTSIIIATTVMNIKNRGKRNPIPEVPPLLSRLCRGPLGKITFSKFSSHINKFNLCSEENAPTMADFEKKFNSHRSLSIGLSSLNVHESFEREILELSDLFGDRETAETETSTKISQLALNECSNEKEHAPFQMNRLKLRRSYKLALKSGIAGEHRNQERPQYECKADICNHEKDQCSTNEMDLLHQHIIVKHEWYFVAETLERVAFIVYVAATCVTIMTLLVILPSVR